MGELKSNLKDDIFVNLFIEAIIVSDIEYHMTLNTIFSVLISYK